MIMSRIQADADPHEGVTAQGDLTVRGGPTAQGDLTVPGEPHARGELTDRLLAGLPAEAVLTDPDVTASYANDMASFCPSGAPAVVVLPRTVEQVQHVMRTATALRVPVVPQGARTGLSGAANASDGCVVLSLTKMDRILEINPVDRVAVVEPGVVNAALSRAVGEHGLYYPPDPSSWETCTIGGNIGTASGGLCCVKYGVTAEYVLGLDVVLADGRLMSTGRRTAKGVAGYDLTRLFVGSEGSLGIVVRAVLALKPQPPQQLVLAAEFASAADACEAVCRIMAGGHVPSLLELMDRTTVKAVNDLAHMGLPETTEALLLAAFDTPDPAADLAAVGALCEAAGATQVVPADDAAESELLLQARRLSLTALEAVKGTTMIDDVCVPRSRLGEMLEGIERIAEKYRLTIGVCAHAGDGNTHPTVCFDAQDADESRRARESFDEIMALGLRLGGTITGEHGVGVLKKEWLAREIGPVGVEMQRAVKQVFDPLGILNPGKLF
ncbi:FAD-binding oxidoreductase [Streptomyces similanensis]